MYLDVEVNLREEIKKITIVLKTARMTDLFNMPVESAFLAEDVGAVGTSCMLKMGACLAILHLMMYTIFLFLGFQMWVDRVVFWRLAFLTARSWLNVVASG